MTSARATRLALQPAAIPLIASTPLARGLVDAWIPHLYADVHSRRLLTTPGTGGHTTEFSKYGKGVLPGSSSNNYFWRNESKLSSAQECTILVIVRPTVNDAITFLCAFGGTTTDNTILGLNFSGSSLLQFWARSDSFGTDQATSASGLSTSAVSVVAGTRSVSANSQRLYVDGAQVGSTTAASGTFSINRTSVGGLTRSGLGFAAAGYYYLFLAWDRALSATEIAQISANPYQVFARPSARIYSFGQAAAPGGTTIPVFRHHYVQQGIG